MKVTKYILKILAGSGQMKNMADIFTGTGKIYTKNYKILS